VVEPVLQEGSAGWHVGDLTLELAVLIEEHSERVEVRKDSLADNDCVHGATEPEWFDCEA
jgi:hypothetical protein